MDQGTAPDSARWSLRSRGPAHAVSHKCLEAQGAARPRGYLARLLGVDPLHPDAVGWYRGALGELRVGGILRALGPEWRVLHAVPHGDAGADIDHLVIGPAGVFTITADLPAAEGDARSASRVLSRASGTAVVAQPIVAVVDPRTLRGVATPAAVVGAHSLVGHLRALPGRLAPDLVATLTRSAEEWTTWRPFGVDLPAHTDPDGAFASLRDEVDRARERRTIWRLAAVAGFAVTLFGVASALFA